MKNGKKTQDADENKRDGHEKEIRWNGKEFKM